MTKQRRLSGILLHPTSLPGRFGVGDIGPNVEYFLDTLVAAGQNIWQVLPLVPPSHYHSPYDALSAFAGNPLLISPESLLADGLLETAELDSVPGFPASQVDFERVKLWKEDLLRRSWQRLNERREDLRREMEAFCKASEQQSWLEDWAMFSALKTHFENRGWTSWDVPLRDRQPDALARMRDELASELDYHCYLQFQFFRQWDKVRDLAKDRGLRIMGDLPIYVSHDSADVWAHREFFDLNTEGQPENVAGVPPDYFAETGQRWGNPLYLWDRLEATGYVWWIERIRANLRLADLIRLDHFRAFAAYWKIDAAEETAVNGEWVDGPGRPFFDAVRRALGTLPLVAEDLGEITEDVNALRDAIGLPGMRVLQFGFDEPGSIHAPHYLVANTTVYTGTHDNDTLAGWFASLDESMKDRVRTYLGADDAGVPWAMIRQAYMSVSDLAIIPVQDLLGLGSEARMNTPGESSGNWLWRLGEGEWSRDKAGRLYRLAELSDRLNKKESEDEKNK